MTSSSSPSSFRRTAFSRPWPPSFALFLFMSVLLLLLVVDENNIRRISEQKELNEHMLMETRMRILENRTYMELRHLVHDLKSPLTSMQALVGWSNCPPAGEGTRRKGSIWSGSRL